MQVKGAALLLGTAVLFLAIGFAAGTLVTARVLTVSQGNVPPPSSPASGVPGHSPSPSAPDTVVLVGAGDIAECDDDGDSKTAAVVEGIPGIVFTLGDNAYEKGTRAEFECYDETWGRFKDRTRPAPGNHEFDTTDAEPYFEYFGEAAGTGPQGYYAYDAGRWRVYVLNSECKPAGGCDTGDEQLRWLASDLDSNPRHCVLAMWHHPLFSSGRHGNHPKMRDVWRVLYDAGADLVLNGHDHTYERFAPQTPQGEPDPDRGIREIIVGTGGKSHYPFPDIQPNSEVRDNTSFGVLKLTLSPGSYHWEFLPVEADGFTDSGAGTCH